jgi:hypothetical protein
VLIVDLDRDEQIAAGHFFRLRHPEQKEKCRSDIRENAVLTAKSRGVFRHVNEVDEICGVRCVWRTVSVAHLLAITVVSRNQTFAVQLDQLGDNARATFIDGFDGFNRCRNNPAMTDHVGVREIEDDQVMICHSRQDFISDFNCAHFWLQIVGRNFR